MSPFDIKTYKYLLDEKLIAQKPLKSRDQARMMVVDRKTSKIIHDRFCNIEEYLPEKTHIVMNESKVIPARLLGKRELTGGSVEIFLLKKQKDPYVYEVLMRPTKRLKEREKIYFGDRKIYAQIINKEKRLVRFNRKDISSSLKRIGHIPLPPYISRKDGAQDKKDYQTVYARRPGSVASPTAGLHFTSSMLENLKSKHSLSKVTLHINYGTFKPVEESDIRQHKMHIEEYSMSQAVHKRIKKSKKDGNLILAIGTTSSRVLESVAKTKKLSGETNIFIYPGIKMQYVDMLLTNFHLPQSTLLMLVYAFGGVDLMRKSYCEAVREKYRFYSYGDCMLIK